MSASLYWRPQPRRKTFLPDELRFALRSTVDGEATTFDASDLDYLRGVRAGGVKGAAELIAAIRKHEQVDVWLEY